jgi:hypothetical protein
MHKFIILAMLLFGPQVCMANYYNHLEPEQSLFTSSQSRQKYHHMVIDALKEVYTKDVVARVIVLPSFEPEYAIALKKHNEEYTVFMASPTMQLSEYKTIEENIENGKVNHDDEHVTRLKALYPTYNEIPLTHCSVAIDADLGDKLLTVWQTMLLTTRYEKDRPNILQIDGVSYHYSTDFFAGQTWSPSQNSKTGKLVAITDALATYCTASTQDGLAHLKETIVNLLSDNQ